MAIGLNTAQYVSATATIGRATGQNISLVAPLERNYNNAIGLKLWLLTHFYRD